PPGGAARGKAAGASVAGDVRREDRAIPGLVPRRTAIRLFTRSRRGPKTLRTRPRERGGTSSDGRPLRRRAARLVPRWKSAPVRPVPGSRPEARAPRRLRAIRRSRRLVARDGFGQVDETDRERREPVLVARREENRRRRLLG